MKRVCLLFLIFSVCITTALSQGLLYEKLVPDTHDSLVHDYQNKFTKTLKNKNILLVGNSHLISYDGTGEKIDTSALLIKIYDQDANLVADTTLYFVPLLFVSEVEITEDSGFVISGRIDTTAVILHFNQQAQLLKLIQINAIARDEVLKGVVEINGAYFVVSQKHKLRYYQYIPYYGWYFPFPYELHTYALTIYINKISSNGEIIWSQMMDTSEISCQNFSFFDWGLDSINITTGQLIESMYMETYWNYSYPSYPKLKKNPKDDQLFFFNSYSKQTTQYDSSTNELEYYMSVNNKFWEINYEGMITVSKSVGIIDNLLDDSLYTTNSGAMTEFLFFDSVILGRSLYYHYVPDDGIFETNITYYYWDYSTNLLDSVKTIVDNNYIGYPDIFQNYFPLTNNSAGDIVYSYNTNYSYDPDNGNYSDDNILSVYTYENLLTNKRKYTAHLTHDIESNRYITETRDGSYLCILNPYYSWDSLLFCKISTQSDEIQYQAFVDNNNNSIYDIGEPTDIRGKIELTHADSSVLYSLDAQGSLSLNLDSGKYVSKLVSYTQKLNNYYIEPDSVITNFTSGRQKESVVFRLVPKTDFQDLQISIIPQNTPRPGFTSSYKVNYSNYGTHTAYNIRITFLKDSLQTYDSATLAQNNFSGDTLVRMIDYLDLYENKNFTVVVVNSPPPFLNMNDTVKLYTTANTNEIDSFPADNNFLLIQAVRNSSDPNDKSESHDGTLTTAQLNNRDYLYYTIRFQNTGNDYALRVTVKDTLSDLLDWRTLEMVASSHSNYILDVKDKRYITWTFNDIYLPDSNYNEPRSHGYITFRIKPKAGLSVNDMITNRASIIFDYNPAVVTNTVTTSIIDERVTIVHNHEIKSIKLYPSPASDHVTLEMNITQPGSYELQITDLSGKNIYSETLGLSAGQFDKQVSLENLPKNMYLITIHAGQNEIYQGKILKQ